MLSPVTLGGGYEKRFQKTSFMCIALNLVIDVVRIYELHLYEKKNL